MRAAFAAAATKLMVHFNFNPSYFIHNFHRPFKDVSASAALTADADTASIVTDQISDTVLIFELIVQWH